MQPVRPGTSVLPGVDFNVLHELGHCAGVNHGTETLPGKECNDVIACCIASINLKGGNRRSCRRWQ